MGGLRRGFAPRPGDSDDPLLAWAVVVALDAWPGHTDSQLG